MSCLYNNVQPDLRFRSFSDFDAIAFSDNYTLQYNYLFFNYINKMYNDIIKVLQDIYLVNVLW